jgi:hypothetical protein
MLQRILAITLALLTGIAAAQIVDGVIADGEYANDLLHEETGTHMYWTIEGDTLLFAMRIGARGWSGVGFGTVIDNRKAGFDQYLFAVEDGEIVAYDMYQEDARGEPVLDTDAGGSASLLEVAATHESELWTVEFSRLLDTGEATDVAIVPGEARIVAFAFGDTMDVGRKHEKSSRGGAYYIEGVTF